MNNLNAIEQLVPVFTSSIGGKQVHVCDARALHTYLGVGKHFASWFTERVEKFGFVENQDFILISQNGEIKSEHGGDRRSKDYHLTLNMAKELGMVENNEMGREVRQYFIRMEQRAIEATTQVAVPQDCHAALLALADATRTFSEMSRILSDTTRALAAKYEPCVATTNTTQSLPIKSVNKSTDLSPISPRERAFIHGWWECFGNKTVTASDLYRAITTKQCQILNDSSGALLGDIELWTAKKLGYALRRWSQLNLDGYRVHNIGKSSHGITWRLELLAA